MIALAQCAPAVLIGMTPDNFLRVRPTLRAFGLALGSATVPGSLRKVAVGHLAWLATPLGFQTARPSNASSAARTPVNN